MNFEQTRLAHVDSDIEREMKNISQITKKSKEFFLPAQYDNPVTYKEMLEQRTQAALAPIKLHA